MVLAFYFDLINVPFMIMLYSVYAVFGSVFTLTAFFSRVYTSEMRISLRDTLFALGLCVAEVVGLRFILSFVRMASLIGYRSEKHRWDKLERQKIDFE